MASGAFWIFLQIFFFQFVTSENSFTYNGFLHANMSLSGAARLTSNGILELTNDTSKILGHAFYPHPQQFKENSTYSSVFSFATTFIFSVKPKYPELGGHGLAFVFSSTKELKNSLRNQYLGLPNETSIAEFSARIVGVEFDTVQSLDLNDINDNHVGIDIGSLISNVSEPAKYFDRHNNKSVILKSGDLIQGWIEYNGKERLLTVTITPFGIPKPNQPLILSAIDLSPLMNEYMYVGFSASTGVLSASHNIHGWSFRIGGRAQDLDPSKIPTFMKSNKAVMHKKGFKVGIALACITLVLLVICGSFQVVQWRKHAEESLEEWEIEYGARRFKFSELLAATREFREENLIGSGGFGSVYKGIIPSTGLEVAIKRVAQDSRQGMREFVAEIMTMGRLRHRNLVQLHGWCRMKDELLLVYDHVPNGSLDDMLFSNNQQKTLNWEQRYEILIGVAHALLYLHEECEHQIVHRDVKPSNILIDADLNPKLGDFGLARISGHTINKQTTQIVGTLGYLAPELTKTGKATTSTDVYGYGALMLEVVCCRRPIEPQKNAHELVLVDWVRELHSRGELMRAVDPALELYNPDEAKLVLGLGLLCLHPNPNYSPSMRKIVQYLLGDASHPLLPIDIQLDIQGLISDFSDGYSQNESNPFSSQLTSSKSTSGITSLAKEMIANHGARATY
ncbi:hypothetical protein MKW94_005336 [Papaver nudicaule]|uniref:non-specific serine/threonine protein kinase n=1 Tax=Papaver nudicaule TaxID=74823 RepID=A0AA41S4K3_PAPNU|nr:hypothetical protein [Papaver nudicaule]